MQLGPSVALALLVVALHGSSDAASLWNEEAKLNAAADGKQYDTFGWSVGVSGNTAIVGANTDDVTLLRPGSAYVFVRSGTTWSRQQRLIAGDASNRDLFGGSVAISGNTAIVGAWRSTSGFGAAYVFARSGTTWTQQQKLDAPAHVTGDICGYAVAISGDTAVLTCENNNGTGAAYIFHRSGTTWMLQGTLNAVNSTAGDFFGFSVAIAGDTVIVGALGDKIGGTQGLGSATVFVRSGTTWTFQQKLGAPDGEFFDRFGISVALSGNTAVVGQVTADDNNQPLNQSAYVFVRSGTTWTYQDKLAAGDAVKADRFGISVAVSGDLAMVGASHDDVGAPPATTNEGSVYVFQRIDGAWSSLGKMTATDQATGHPVTGNLFGFSVAISGTAGIIGAPNRQIGTNLYQGQAYAFLNPDTDGDTLPDDWESKGVTIDGVFIDLPKMGADPHHKDLFVHADWMHPDPANPSAVFKPSARAMKNVTDAFAVAPVDNPDHKVGINLHIDLGPNSVMNPKKGITWGAFSRAGEIPYQAAVGSVDAMGNFVWTGIDTLKNTHFTPTKRDAAFHYALFANDYAGSNGSTGISRGAPGIDFLVTFGLATPRGGTLVEQACCFMHELGHNLGLLHGGDDDVNKKPNYVSVMNYLFSLTGLIRSGRQRQVDYSGFLLPLNETSLDETVGIVHPLHYLTLWNELSRPTLPAGSNKCVSNDNYHRLFLPSEGLDWDCDGVKSTTPVAADVNGDGDCILPGPNGIADTAIAGVMLDDDPRRFVLWSGPNRTCDTPKIGDDVQNHPVGYVEAGPVLNSFKDWSHLDFGGGGALGNVANASTPPSTTPIVELPRDEILSLSPQSLLDEEAVAPLDEVTLSTQEGPAPLLVDFDGSASTAVSGTITDWAWDFGDGTTGTGATTQHTYDTPGEYFASLTVTDSDGRVNLVPLLNLVTVTDGNEPTPTPTPTAGAPLTLDHFVLYATGTSKGAAKFQKLGPLTLADAFLSSGYDVAKPTGLALPADTNGGGFVDASTNLSAFAIKPAKGAAKPGPHANVRVANACGESVVTTGKPVTLLVPSALGLAAPVTAPNEADHEVDHFLCYQAKAQKKDTAGAALPPFPKGVQADVTDLFATRRFDLKKVVVLCNPVSKSGTPLVLSGPTKGTPVAITPAAVRHPGSHLLCYQASLAKKRIEQTGCGPATAGDKGTAITQTKHAPRLGVHVADQLGARQLDTKKESLLCLPSTLPAP